MATWNNIIDNVGDELGLDSYKSSGADASRSQHALNRVRQKVLTVHPFTWNMEDTPLAVSTVVNQTAYDLSSSAKILDIHGVVLDTGDTQTRTMCERSMGFYLSQYASVAFDPANKPRDFARSGKYTINLAPKPDAIYTMRIWYSLEPTDLTVFTGTAPLPDRALEVIELGMLARLYRLLHEYDHAAELKQDFNDALGTLVKEDKDNPALHYIRQPFRQAGVNTEYWKSPFF